ncbi:MAG: helix-turn-helix domain-containing protein [Clostridia bacterium]|nr:helix-turn-helix domain-containing protein [Clostridia bacterium]
MNTLGERIYELRTRKGMSQGNLADSLDVSRQTVSKWENNQSVPELDRIIAMSDIFGVSVDYIVKGEGLPTERKENAFAEPFAPEKTVKINNTENYISGIAVSVSLIFLISVFSGVIGTVTNILYGYSGFNSILTVAGIAVNIFAIASLLSLNMSLVGISYAVHTVMSIVNIALNGFNVIPVIITAAYGVMAYLCFRGNRKNIKPLCIFACLLFVICDALSLGSAVYNFYIVAEFTPRNTFMSFLSMLMSQVPSLVFHSGVCAVMYLKVNPLPDREIPESFYKKEMYIPLAKHILLTLFTLGIYDCIWVYRTTEGLNCDGTNEKQSGYRKLLLCALVPFYRIYWFYAQAKRLERLMKKEAKATDSLASVIVILAVFLPVAVPGAFLQMKINELAE